VSVNSPNRSFSILKYRLWTAISALCMVFVLIGCGPKWQLSPPAAPPPAVVADSGMVVAAHPLAAEAGIAVLKQGGNAVDAALAALFMLNVVEPHASGLGGGGFALVRTAAGDAKVVVYRERAPRDVDTSIYYNPLDSLRKLRGGGTAVCVPGAPAGWAELYSRWGTLPLEYLAGFAIRAADEGFPVDPTLARQIKDYYQLLSTDTLLAKVFLKDGLPYEVGDTLRQPLLANTLQTLAANGLGSFYRGPIAESVVEAAYRGGGSLSLEDLEFYRCDVVEPLSGKYKDYEVLTVPPPSGGGAALLETLQLYERVSAHYNPASRPAATHIMAQCLQQAYADADAFIADPDVTKFDPAGYFSGDRLAKAAQGINLKAKPAGRTPVSPPPVLGSRQSGNTTHLVVVDRWGNAVSLTQSINYFFGAGILAGSTGLLLNNQMADFSTPLDSVNLLGPRRRPRSNMTPLIVLKDGKPMLVIGTPGGGRIVAATAQLAVNILDFGMDISAAVDAPRFFPMREHLVLENRQAKKEMKALANFGYTLHFAPPFHHYFGGAHGIWLDPQTVRLLGAADRRRGGAAKGY